MTIETFKSIYLVSPNFNLFMTYLFYCIIITENNFVLQRRMLKHNLFHVSNMLDLSLSFFFSLHNIMRYPANM